MRRIKLILISLLITTNVISQNDFASKVYVLSFVNDLEMYDSNLNPITLTNLESILFDYFLTFNCYDKRDDKFINLSIHNPDYNEQIYLRELLAFKEDSKIEMYTGFHDENTGALIENPIPALKIDTKDSFKLENLYVFDQIKNYKEQIFRKGEKYKLAKVVKGNKSYPITSCMESFKLEFKENHFYETSFNNALNCTDSINLEWEAKINDNQTRHNYTDLIEHKMWSKNGYYLSNKSTLALFSVNLFGVSKYKIIHKDDKKLILKSLNNTIVEFKRYDM